jgi:hypothetical protein
VQRVLLGEFDSADGCARAISTLRARGYSELDAYLPYPDKSVEDALALPRSPLPKYVLAFGILGALVGYTILWWTQNVDYPLDVGSHPTNAIPAYIGITFETAVLFACSGAFFGLLRLCRLPKLWHPVFELEGFERASIDRFFVVVGRDTNATPTDELEAELGRLGALRSVTLDLEGERP